MLILLIDQFLLWMKKTVITYKYDHSRSMVWIKMFKHLHSPRRIYRKSYLVPSIRRFFPNPSMEQP